MRKILRSHRHSHKKYFPNRILAAQMIVLLLFGGIIFRLFHLQVVEGTTYSEKGNAQSARVNELSAYRGRIYVKDSGTGNMITMAMNTTLDSVAVDPSVTANKRIVADTLAPLLYSDDDYADCLEDPKFCPEGSVQIIQPEPTENLEEYVKPTIIYPTKKEATEAYAHVLYRKINKDKRDYSFLSNELTDEILNKVEALRLPGIYVVRENFMVYANPLEVPQDKKERERIAKTLAPLIDWPEKDLAKALLSRKVQHVNIKKEIRPEISEKIKELKGISRETHLQSKAQILAEKSGREPTPDYFKGIKLEAVPKRYYPDKELGAHIIGFVNREKQGQYGIEGKFNRVLSGKAGTIESRVDAYKRVVSLQGVSREQNGSNILLTIDRVVQKKVEEVLEEATKRFRADSGQVIVLEPKTGRILAMANAPLFDPNEFGNSYLMRRTTPEDSREIFKTTPLFTKDDLGRFQVSNYEEFDTAWREGFDPEFYIYRNRLGPGAFVNRTVQEVYEPGSVFKPIIMAAAIETGEVSPTTTFNEDGPVQVGDFWIRTALGEYNGIQTMTNVLETSSNVGMVFVALKLGKSLMHSFITDKFGFGDYTDIDLDEESPGKVFPKKDWSDAHLLTASFGQGLTVTPIQIVRAWGALANGGMLMRPQIVDSIIHSDGTIEEIDPEPVRRAISADTSQTITSMMVSGVDNGVAWPAQIKGYRVAGKTGTSQIAGSDGKYETGEGAFITSFAGYAPAEDPRFLVYVKFDRPRYGADNTWGSTTAAPVFREVMTFLLEYKDVPPDENRL